MPIVAGIATSEFKVFIAGLLLPFINAFLAKFGLSMSAAELISVETMAMSYIGSRTFVKRAATNAGVQKAAALVGQLVDIKSTTDPAQRQTKVASLLASL